jgi:hypothetical protein
MKNLILIFALVVLQDRPETSIEGQVVDATTNAPITGAEITAMLGRRVSATSGEDGRFVLSGVQSGPQRLRVTRDGYAPARPESRRTPGNWMLQVTLAPQQQLKGFTVRLFPSGSISGTVLDTRGDPVQGVTVIASRPYFFKQESRFGPAPEGPIPSFATAETNDKGDFRLFGLDAGDYYVLVDAGWGATRRGPQGGELYRSLYYPGVPELDRAQAISVRSGEEVRAGTLTTPALKTAPVHVRIVNQTGQPLPERYDTREIYLDDEGGVFTAAQAWGGPTAIALPPLAEGIHNIAVAWQKEGGHSFFGQQRLVVGSEEVYADLIVGSGGRLIGNVVLEASDGKRTPAAGVRVNFIGKITGGSALNGLTATAAADGTFNFASVPELPYHISYNRLPPNAYVAAATIGNQDVLGRDAFISAGSEMEVVIRADGATINGTVRDSKGRPVSGAFVVLAPESARDRWPLYRTVTSDQDGKFVLQGIGPADYKAFAWIGMEGAAYLDNAYMVRFEGAGKPVSLGSGQSITLELSLSDEGGEK